MPMLVKSASRWSLSRGPMAATINTVADLGWKPASPSHWRVNERMMACVGGASFSKAHIMARAQADLVAKLAGEASRHPHGSGITSDICLGGARRAKARLIKAGDLAAATALDYVVTGVYKDPEPSGNGENYRTEQYCHRCGGTVLATRWHELYECPDNVHVDGEDEASRAEAGKLTEEAKEKWATEACLYARGITPTSQAGGPVDIDFDRTTARYTDGFHDLLAKTRCGYSDGSGGSDDIHPRVREAASGAAVYEWDPVGEKFIVEGLTARVLGRQTAPRAEVWAAALLTEAAPSEGYLRIVLDASYVKHGIERRGNLLRGPNGDLWSILLSLLDGRSGPSDIIKVKSHVIDHGATWVTDHGHKLEDVTGNEFADAAAEAGVTLLKELDDDTSRRAHRADEKACRIAMRLGRVQARIWQKLAGAKLFQPPVTPQLAEEDFQVGNVMATIMRDIAKMGHRPFRTRGGLRCDRCEIFNNWSGREFWTRNKCQPRMSARQLVVKHRRLAEAAAAPTATNEAFAMEAMPSSKRALGVERDEGEIAIGPPMAKRRAKWECVVDDDGSRRWLRAYMHGDPDIPPGALVTGPPELGDRPGQGLDDKTKPVGASGSGRGAEFLCPPADAALNDAVQGGGPSSSTCTTSAGEGDGSDAQAESGPTYGEAAVEIGSVSAAMGTKRVKTAHKSDEVSGLLLVNDFDDPEGDLRHPEDDLEDELMGMGGMPYHAVEDGDGPAEEEKSDLCPSKGDDHGHSHPGDRCTTVACGDRRQGVDVVDGGGLTAGAGSVRRRLRTKTRPRDAPAFPQEPNAEVLAAADLAPVADVQLLTRQAAVAARKRVRDAVQAHAKRVKEARTAAWAAVHRSSCLNVASESQLPEGPQQQPDVEEDLADWGVHDTHDVKKAPGIEVVYCSTCGAWTSGRKARKLKVACSGVPGHKGNLRLLQAGIAPHQGARMPRELKVDGARGTRNGACSRGRRWKGARVAKSPAHVSARSLGGCTG